MRIVSSKNPVDKKEENGRVFLTELSKLYE